MVRCVEPQLFVAVRVMVSVPSKLAAEYVTEMVPLLVPLIGEKELPSEDEKDQLVAFATVKVIVAVSPYAMVPGVTLRELIVGSGFTGMVTDPDFEQPLPFVTVTLSVAGPAEPVSKVMLSLPCPEAMVALTAVHA